MRTIVKAAVLFVSIGMVPAAAAKTLALKDFRQMLVGMSVATGVNYRDDEIQAIYQRVRTRLPLTGAVEDMSSPMVLAVTELAGAFCDKMIKADAELDDRALRRAHKEVDFRRGPASLSDPVLASVAQEYTDLFWQRSASDQELRMLVEALQTARDEASTSAPAATIDSLKVGCAVAATSLAALLN